MSVGLLVLEAGSRDGVDIVRASGEIDTSNAQELESALLALTGRRAVVDLTGVAYLDSAGVRALDRGLSALVARGGAFRAVAPAGSPARLTLRVSGYNGDTIAGDLDSALAGL